MRSPFFLKLTNSPVRLPVTSSKTFRVWAIIVIYRERVFTLILSGFKSDKKSANMSRQAIKDDKELKMFNMRERITFISFYFLEK